MKDEDKCLLQQAAKQKDIVSLRLCMHLYDVCNDKLFDFLTPLEFSNFLNLKGTQPVIVNSRQQIRVCYLAYCIKQAISPQKNAKIWVEAFLEQCGIKQSYYNSHYREVCNKDTTKDNKNFRQDIDFALERAFKKKVTT